MSTYKVTLETKGPLYIGSGKQLGKKEYIHNRQEKEIVVPNLIKMYQQLNKKNLTGEYEKFLLNPKEKALTEDGKINLNKKKLRHEIVHAFLFESGLSSNTHGIYGAWAENEEMVDWIAIQSPKIFKVFQELEIL